MKTLLSAAAMTAALVCSSAAWGAPLLQSTDFIIPIDRDPPALTTSSYPGNEAPINAFDFDPTFKYLNFGEQNSGLIVTPSGPASIVRSLVFTTANDAVERDPTSYKIWGTNDAIVTTDNFAGPNAENWSLISEGALALPDDRFTEGPAVSFPNATAYSSYRITFPTVKNTATANSMQIGEIGMFRNVDGLTDPIVVDVTVDPVLAILLVPIPTFNSSSPGNETVPNLLDGDVNTKYLNFGENNSGFIVTPAGGNSIATGFQISTANDAEPRDPASYIVYGTNDPITSLPHQDGAGENWTQITMGDLALPFDRLTEGEPVTFANTTAYKSYRVVFPLVKDDVAANSMQISEFQFDGTFVAGADADFDGDGDIDGNDFVKWQRGIGLTGQTTNANGDADGNGTVNAADLVEWRNQFGGAATAAAGSVPEPSAALLTIAAIGAAAGLARRRQTYTIRRLMLES